MDRTNTNERVYGDKKRENQLGLIKQVPDGEHEDFFGKMNKPTGEYDIGMKNDVIRITGLCKTILDLGDIEFAKAIEVLRSSNDPMADVIHKFLVEERRA